MGAFSQGRPAIPEVAPRREPHGTGDQSGEIIVACIGPLMVQSSLSNSGSVETTTSKSPVMSQFPSSPIVKLPAFATSRSAPLKTRGPAKEYPREASTAPEKTMSSWKSKESELGSPVIVSGPLHQSSSHDGSSLQPA